ncbi:ATP-binding cassette domain-containing protein [Actinoplanes sp. NPDC000266]
MTALLRLDQACGRYGAVTAVHPLTLDITAGARQAIIGPNGAGKSTLLHLIAGTLRPASGRIRFDDRDITRRSPGWRARHGIGRTFQHPATIDALTVRDNLTLADGRHSAGPDRMLERLGLTEHADTPAARLSYGQRRFLELGMALTGRPRLLLLDEPSAGLDPADIFVLHQLLAGLPGEVTVLLVDHHLDLVMAVADTITVLHHGQHLATGSPQQIRQDPGVRDAYLNPPTTSTHDPAPTATPSTGTGAAVRVHELRAGYHGADVLAGIDLTLAPGEVHAVLGRNGAGKTTLINTMAGLHPARGGHLILDGTTLGHARPCESRVAVVPQGRRLFAALTGREHLTLAARLRGAAPIDLDTFDALTTALDGHLDRLPGQLSGGQQQLLALARAVSSGPRLLLLDEPTEGLAPLIIDRLRTILTGLSGVTVLLAEQNLAFARAVADRISVLHDGRLVHTVTTTELADPAVLDRLHTYLGVAITADLAGTPRPGQASA